MGVNQAETPGINCEPYGKETINQRKDKVSNRRERRILERLFVDILFIVVIFSSDHFL